MIERSLQLDANNTSNSSNSSRNAIRPTDLPTENRKWARHRKLEIELIFSVRSQVPKESAQWRCNSEFHFCSLLPTTFIICYND